MPRRDRTPLPPDVARELAALDAAIAGEAVDPDLTELASLAVTVRDARPRPDAGVIARLDERAAAGFAQRPAPSRPASRRRVLLPAAACAIALATIAGAAVLSSGGGDSPDVVETAPAGTETVTTDVGALDRSSRTDATAKAAPAPSSGSATATVEAAPAVTTPVAPRVTGGAPARSVERGAELNLATTPGRLDDVASAVVRTTDGLAGYVVSSSVEDRGGAGGSATFDLRVPSPRLQTALARLSQIARVRSRSETSLDVTGSVVAARDRVDALTAERRGVLRQLAAATTAADTAHARDRLRAVDVRLARAQAAREQLRRRTAYSTIAVEVTTQRPSAGGTSGGDGSWTPGDALRDALRVLSIALGAALVALAALLPVGLLAAAGWAAWRVTRTRRRHSALDAAN